MHTWLNEPAKWHQQGQSLTVTTDPDTDFWQITHYGFQRDSGHAFLQEVQGDFECSLTFKGNYRDLYDQAGLMVRVGPDLWLKTGIEYVEGVHQLSVVVTRGHSDWSVSPVQGPLASTSLRLKRNKEAITIEGSVNGGPFSLMRMLYFPEGGPVWVGPMCCSPTGQGFEAHFTDFSVVSLQQP